MHKYMSLSDAARKKRAKVSSSLFLPQNLARPKSDLPRYIKKKNTRRYTQKLIKRKIEKIDENHGKIFPLIKIGTSKAKLRLAIENLQKTFSKKLVTTNSTTSSNANVNDATNNSNYNTGSNTSTFRCANTGTATSSVSINSSTGSNYNSSGNATFTTGIINTKTHGNTKSESVARSLEIVNISISPDIKTIENGDQKVNLEEFIQYQDLEIKKKEPQSINHNAITETFIPTTNIKTENYSPYSEHPDFDLLESFIETEPYKLLVKAPDHSKFELLESVVKTEPYTTAPEQSDVEPNNKWKENENELLEKSGNQIETEIKTEDLSSISAFGEEQSIAKATKGIKVEAKEVEKSNDDKNCTPILSPNCMPMDTSESITTTTQQPETKDIFHRTCKTQRCAHNFPIFTQRNVNSTQPNASHFEAVPTRKSLSLVNSNPSDANSSKNNEPISVDEIPTFVVNRSAVATLTCGVLSSSVTIASNTLTTNTLSYSVSNVKVGSNEITKILNDAVPLQQTTKQNRTADFPPSKNSVLNKVSLNAAPSGTLQRSNDRNRIPQYSRFWNPILNEIPQKNTAPSSTTIDHSKEINYQHFEKIASPPLNTESFTITSSLPSILLATPPLTSTPSPLPQHLASVDSTASHSSQTWHRAQANNSTELTTSNLLQLKSSPNTLLTPALVSSPMINANASYFNSDFSKSQQMQHLQSTSTCSVWTGSPGITATASLLQSTSTFHYKPAGKTNTKNDFETIMNVHNLSPPIPLQTPLHIASTKNLHGQVPFDNNILNPQSNTHLLHAASTAAGLVSNCYMIPSKSVAAQSYQAVLSKSAAAQFHQTIPATRSTAPLTWPSVNPRGNHVASNLQGMPPSQNICLQPQQTSSLEQALTTLRSPPDYTVSYHNRPAVDHEQRQNLTDGVIDYLTAPCAAPTYNNIDTSNGYLMPLTVTYTATSTLTPLTTIATQNYQTIPNYPVPRPMLYVPDKTPSTMSTPLPIRTTAASFYQTISNNQSNYVYIQRTTTPMPPQTPTPSTTHYHKHAVYDQHPVMPRSNCGMQLMPASAAHTTASQLQPTATAATHFQSVSNYQQIMPPPLPVITHSHSVDALNSRSHTSQSTINRTKHFQYDIKNVSTRRPPILIPTSIMNRNAEKLASIRSQSGIRPKFPRLKPLPIISGNLEGSVPPMPSIKSNEASRQAAANCGNLTVNQYINFEPSAVQAQKIQQQSQQSLSSLKRSHADPISNDYEHLPADLTVTNHMTSTAIEKHKTLNRNCSSHILALGRRCASSSNCNKQTEGIVLQENQVSSPLNSPISNPSTVAPNRRNEVDSSVPPIVNSLQASTLRYYRPYQAAEVREQPKMASRAVESQSNQLNAADIVNVSNPSKNVQCYFLPKEQENISTSASASYLRMFKQSANQSNVNINEASTSSNLTTSSSQNSTQTNAGQTKQLHSISVSVSRVKRLYAAVQDKRTSTLLPPPPSLITNTANNGPLLQPIQNANIRTISNLSNSIEHNFLVPTSSYSAEISATRNLNQQQFNYFVNVPESAVPPARATNRWTTLNEANDAQHIQSQFPQISNFGSQTSNTKNTTSAVSSPQPYSMTQHQNYFNSQATDQPFQPSTTGGSTRMTKLRRTSCTTSISPYTT